MLSREQGTSYPSEVSSSTCHHKGAHIKSRWSISNGPRQQPQTEAVTGVTLSELLSSDQLKHHAAKLATYHPVDRNAGEDRLLPRLAQNESIIVQAYSVVTRAASAGQAITPAETWLLDNFYLIEQQIALARRHLPRDYSRQLPRLSEGPLAGYPRIHDLALDLIAHQDGRIDRDNTGSFIASYQSVEPLELGELWAFPIMLRLGLLENIGRVATRIARRRAERDLAVKWADRLLVTAEEQPKRLIHLLAELAEAPVSLTATFVEDFYARLQDHGPVIGVVQAWLEHQLSQEGVSTSGLLDMASRAAASDQISIANSIGSLRFISALDWGQFVEDLSPVEQLLSTDPAGVYSAQDFATRDRYRHVVEAVARGTQQNESEVVRAALALAQAAADRSGVQDRTAHVGYYLVSRGRRSLEQAVGSRVPLLTRLARVPRPLRLFSYVAPIVILSAIAVALPIAYATALDRAYVELIFFTLVGFLAASALVVPVVNQLVTVMLPPRVLPRLDFHDGIPKAHRTLVVIPTLVGSPDQVTALLEALEVRYLGNRDPNLFFALLTDFNDASEQRRPGDDELRAHLRTGVETLNETYAEDGQDVFYLFHRQRVWNPRDRVWMGYERKRGKLEQLNALLLAARADDERPQPETEQSRTKAARGVL